MNVETGPGPGALLFRRGDAAVPVGGGTAAFLSVVEEEGGEDLPSFGAVMSVPDGSATVTPTAEGGAEADGWGPGVLLSGPMAAPSGPVAQLPVRAAVAAIGLGDGRRAALPVQAMTADPSVADATPAGTSAAAAGVTEAAPSVGPAPGVTEREPPRAAMATPVAEATDAAPERGEVSAAPSPGAGPSDRPATAGSVRALPEEPAGAPALATGAEDIPAAVALDPDVPGSRAAETRAETALAPGAPDVAGAPATDVSGKAAGVAPAGAADAGPDQPVTDGTVGAARDSGPPRRSEAGSPARLVPAAAFVTQATTPQAAPSAREGTTPARETPAAVQELPAVATGAVGPAAPVAAASAVVQIEPALNQQALPAPLAQAQLSPPQQDPPRVERAPREESPERVEAPETGGSIPSSAMEVRSPLPEAGARGPALQPQMTEAPAGGLEVGDPALPLVGVDLATRTAADGSAAAPAAPPGAGADQTGRSVAQQLVAAVLNSGDGGFEIRLSPEELGRVTLSLQVTDDSVVLSIQADRQDTLDLMRRNTDILLREFREAGFASLSFAFGQGSADGRPARVPGYSGTIEGRVHDTAAAAVPPATAGRAPSSARLDLRL